MLITSFKERAKEIVLTITRHRVRSLVIRYFGHQLPDVVMVMCDSPCRWGGGKSGAWEQTWYLRAIRTRTMAYGMHI